MGDGQADKIDFRKGLERALLRIEALKRENAELAAGQRKSSEAIAVIGIGCRFPQIENPNELWQFLLEGRDAVREIPANRPELARIAELYPRTRWGSLFESLDGFDARFFGMSPREANWLDPQQRLLLEVCIEALEDSGIALRSVEGTRTGVFVGMIGGPGYEEAARALDPSELDAYTFTGIAHSIAAGRVAHTLGLQGPALIVDTACSSSLVAIHLACQSLRRGECDQVLAGGVSLIQSPSSSVMAAKVTALSEDGRCRTFDAAASGIARGEGAGVVVLKRLTDALAQGDQILAVVKGSAINHDGRAVGLGVPSVLAQTAVVKDALQDAGVPASSIGFIETHGTGTSIGDPIELTALKNVIGTARSDGSTCRLGAIKTNLGHTEAAAGVAGFIKCVLAVRHGAIPPNLHFRVLNPRISLTKTPLTIPTEVTPWPAGAQPRRAGVSSFGMSGTNAHIVLEEFAPAPDPQPTSASESNTHSSSAHNTSASASPQQLAAAERRDALPLSARDSNAPAPGVQLPAAARRYVLPLSALDTGALAQAAERYASLLEAAPESALEDICFSAGHRRSHYATRLAVTGTSREELCAGLRSFAAGSGAPNLVQETMLPNAPVKVMFVFSGFGSQWPGMGRQLYASQPSFREAFDACNAELERLSGKSLTQALLADASAPSWTDLETLQLLLFAMQVALSTLWRSWGVEPDAVLGTSLGEVAAAHVAGALSLGDAAHLVHERVRLLQRLVGSGSMLATELGLERATSVLQGYEDRVGIAANNSPRSIILSGNTQALTELKKRLDDEGEFCRWVKGATGPGHSPAVDSITPELRAALQQLTPRASSLPFYSSVTGAPCSGERLDADYWARNIREQVAFGPTLGLAIRDGHRVLIEISPHPVLLPSMMQVIAHGRVACAALASERRDHDELTHLTQSLAQLFVHGGPIDFRRCYPSGRALSLPTYPFQRRRFWNDPPIKRIAGLPSARDSHPVLGARLALSVPGLHVWQRTLLRSKSAWLAEHRIAGGELLPTAALIEMIVTAAAELGAVLPIALVSVTFYALPMLRADEHPTLQLTLSEATSGMYQFRLSQALASETAAGEPSWRLCLEGSVGQSDAAAEPERTQPLAADASAVDVYAVLAAQDTVYGAPLQALERARTASGELWAELLPSAGAPDLQPLRALEACVQAAACARRSAGSHAAQAPAWPRSIARLVLRAPLPERGPCAVVAGRSGWNVVLSDSLTIEGLILEELDVSTLAALRALRPATAASEPKMQDLLATLNANADPAQRGTLVRDYLRREIARVSRARPEDISDDLPFLQLGIDSIMGLELRSRLEITFQLELPATVIYSYPDLHALSRFILEASGLAQASEADPVKPSVSERSSWLLRPVPRGKQALRLLVFPFSGGTASAFVHWASRLPDQIELCAVELPGRGFRFRQPAHEEFFALVDALDRELRASRDQPCALFGHSMGAMVAFELARRWSTDGGTPPQRLFVSGLPAPQWFDTTTLREALAEDRLLEHLAKWGAVAPAARDQDVLALGMSAMQSDLRALASWSYREAAPLPCPITALRGTTDPLTPLEPTQAWRQHTHAEFRLVTFAGDHFYFQNERARLLRVLADDLLSTHALVEQVSMGA